MYILLRGRSRRSGRRTQVGVVQATLLAGHYATQKDKSLVLVRYSILSMTFAEQFAFRYRSSGRDIPRAPPRDARRLARR